METIKRFFLSVGIVITATVCSTLWWSYFAWSMANWFSAKDAAAIQLDATLAALTITPVAVILGMLVNAAREAKARKQ